MTSPLIRLLAGLLVVMVAFSMTVGAATAGAQTLASDSSNGSDGLPGEVNGTASAVVDKLEATDGLEPDEAAESADATETPDEPAERTSGQAADRNRSALDATKDAVDDAVENATADATPEEASNGSETAVDDADAAANESDGSEVGETTGTTDEPVRSVGNVCGVKTPTLESEGAVAGVANATDRVEASGGTATDAVDATVENASDATVTAANETAGNATDGAVSTHEESADGVANVTADGESTTTQSVDAVADESALGTATKTLVNDTASTSDQVVRDGTETSARVVATTDAARENLTAVVEETAEAIERTVDGATDGVDRTVDDVRTTVDGDATETTVVGTFTRQDGAAEARQLGTSEWNDAVEEPTVERDVYVMPPGERDGDETGDTNPDASESDGSGALDGVDPAGGEALLGALLVSGSLVATRTGMAASTAGAAGAGTTTQLAFAMLKEWFFRLAVLAGYSRYDFDDPLENENRATVFETVEESPGINLSAVVEETGLAESTVRYHLRVLDHEGLVEAAKVRGRRRYVPQAGGDVELVAAMEEEATKEVLETLLEREPATGTALADALDRDKSTVSHHLSRLSEAGLVEREPDGPALMNSLRPDVRQALEPVEVHSSVQQHVRADD